MPVRKYALVMAGGEGRRAGSEMPKQFVKLLGIPMLWWSVMAFHDEDPDTEISIVMHPGFFDDYDIMLSELPREVRGIRVRLVAGGRTRGESVANGILALPDSHDTLIAVHDAARPLLSPELAARAWRCAAANGTAVPVCPVTDSLRELTTYGSEAVDRSRFVSVQTPQVFRADILHSAYRLPERPEFTDDASRVEANGVPVTLLEGDASNFKVTNPADFATAEALLRDNGFRNDK